MRVTLTDYRGGGGAPMRSPTGLTHTVPRQNSPRHPRAPDPQDHRGRSPLKSPGKTSRSFELQDPRMVGRRRGYEEMGRFGQSHSLDSALPGPPRAADDDILGIGLNCKSTANNAAISAREYTRKYAPIAQKGAGICLDHTAHAADIAEEKFKEGFKDFAMTAAEVYRQECKTEDADFQKKQKPGAKGKKTIFRKGNERSPANANDNNSLLSDSASITDTDQRDSNSDQRKRKGHRRRKSEPSNLRQERRSPEVIKVMSDHEDEFAPPRVGRSSGRDFEPKAQDNRLMEARLELFRLGQETVPQNSVRLARALQDLKRQDKLIDGWKRQFEMTQKHLDETMAELDKTKKEAQNKQFKSTEMRARSVQDRKKFEDLYRKELEEKKRLEDKISKMQVEMASMKLSLRNRQPPGGFSSPASQGPGSPPSSGQVMALKAEIVDLKSQLAEAHAASIDDASSLNTNEEIEKLKSKLRTAEKELAVLRQEKQQLSETERNLTEQLELAESMAKETEDKLQRDLTAARESEKKAKSELAKVSANLQRMERERSRKRIHSAADIERLNKQLEKSRTEITSLQGRLDGEKSVQQEELARLRMEIEILNEKRAESSREITDAKKETTEQKRRWEKELLRLTGELHDLKKQLEYKTFEITKQDERIQALQAGDFTRSYDNPISSDRELSLLKEEIKFRKANENTLRADLKLHKSMLAQAEARAERKEFSSLGNMQRDLQAARMSEEKKSMEEEAKSMMQMEIVSLQSKVSQLESAAQTRFDAEVTTKSNEEAYRAEIAQLKAKLSSTEKMSYEEKFRAEEERRFIEMTKKQHEEELDELRREYEKNSDEKMKLREELEELRKALAGSNDSRGIAEGDGMEAPKNVQRLRNEMAIARARLAAARDQTRTVVPSPSKPSQYLRIVTPPGQDGTTQQSKMSLLDEDNDEGTPFSLLHDTTGRREISINAASPGSREVNRSRGDDSVEELRRQLAESSKRLEKANTRLNGLVETTGLHKGTSPARSPFQGINRDTILTLRSDDQEEADDGILNDIMTTASGNIEVARLRYANI